MRRSAEKFSPPTSAACRISCPRPNAPDHDAKLAPWSRMRSTKQRETGLDIINEGEFAKHGDWLRYAKGRLGGCEPRKVSSTVFTKGEDREEFAAFYKYATESGTLFYRPNEELSRGSVTCLHRADHLSREGRDQREIETFRAALGRFPPQERF